MSEAVKNAINATIDNLRLAIALDVEEISPIITGLDSDNDLAYSLSKLSSQRDPLKKKLGERVITQLKSFPEEARGQIVERALSSSYL